MTTFDNTFAKTIEAETELVLSSSHFSRSVLLTRFLRFVVQLSLEGKSHELKEYRLGVEVFERGNSFDPRIDPVVRVQAAKLRAKLAEYYAIGPSGWHKLAWRHGGGHSARGLCHGGDAMNFADCMPSTLPTVNYSYGAGNCGNLLKEGKDAHTERN
jgi:hypothetical protein